VSEREACKEPIKIIDQQSLALLDPTGARSKLFDPDNVDCAKPGDILLTTFKTGEPFSGIIMAVKGSGPHKSVLLRNHLTRIGTEMSIKIHSPLVQSMEIAQRGTKKRKRARLYYLRQPKHDVGSVQRIVDQYVRERALLSGQKTGRRSTTGAKRTRK
jgi:ribosomal protein L19